MSTDIKFTMDRISKVFSKKYNNIIKDCILSRSESWINKYTIKLKTSAKNKAGTILRLKKKNIEDKE